MADCARYREMLSGLVDNTLSDTENKALSEHLEGCAACRALLSVYREITMAAEESMAEPPEDFTAGVMERIKALGNENAATGKPAETGSGAAAGGAKTKKSFKPVIISFVAAAACLALVFLVSPQLFQFAGSNKTTSVADAPHASAAPADYGQQAPMPAAGGQQESALKTADASAEQADGAQDSDAGVPPEPLMGIMASPVPAPSAEPTSGQTGGIPYAVHVKAGALTDYYAVITIKGELPEFIAGNTRTANSNGTYNIEVTVDVAVKLVTDGYPSEAGNAEKTTALVVYTP